MITDASSLLEIEDEDDEEKEILSQYKNEIRSMDSQMEDSSQALASKCSLDGEIKTEYIREQETLEKTTDRDTRHLMDKIDEMDPKLS